MASTKKSIYDVLIKTKTDFARANLFEIELIHPYLTTWPNIGVTRNQMDQNAKTTALFVKQISIPVISMNSIILSRGGITYQLPNPVTFGEASGSFYLDKKGITRKYFTDWMKLYNHSFESAVSSTHVDQFMTGQLILYSLDPHTMERITKTVYYNCFPKMMGDIDFSHDAVDTLPTFTILFAYHRFEFQQLIQ